MDSIDRIPRGPSGATRHAQVLQSEGVHVEQGNMGEWTVDFQTYGWFPDVLPGQQDDGDDSEDDDETG